MARVRPRCEPTGTAAGADAVVMLADVRRHAQRAGGCHPEGPACVAPAERSGPRSCPWHQQEHAAPSAMGACRATHLRQVIVRGSTTVSRNGDDEVTLRCQRRTRSGTDESGDGWQRALRDRPGRSRAVRDGLRARRGIQRCNVRAAPACEAPQHRFDAAGGVRPDCLRVPL